MSRQQLRARVEHWCRLLAPEWRITLLREAQGDLEDLKAEGCVGAVKPNENTHDADLWIAEDHHRDKPLGEVDVTIVHELLHLELGELSRTVDDLEDLLHPDTYKAIRKRFKSQEERTIERLARLIAKLEHPDGIVYGVDDPPQEKAA